MSGHIQYATAPTHLTFHQVGIKDLCVNRGGTMEMDEDEERGDVVLLRRQKVQWVQEGRGESAN